MIPILPPVLCPTHKVPTFRLTSGLLFCPKCNVTNSKSLPSATKTAAARGFTTSSNRQAAINEPFVPALWQAWVESAAVVAIWLLIVQPSAVEGSSATLVAFASLIGFLVLLFRRWRVANLCGGKIPDSFGVTRDLAIAFAIMAATGTVFAIVNSQLQQLTDVKLESLTLRKIAFAQSEIATRADILERGKLSLKISLAVLVCTSSLLAFGKLETFGWLFLQFGRIKKILKLITVLSLCVGSFCLAGAAASANALAGERKASYAFFTAIHDAEKELRNRLSYQISEVVAQSLKSKLRASCSNILPKAENCPEDPVAGMYAAHDTAMSFQDRWPAHPSAFDLPTQPAKSDVFRQASSDISEIASIHVRSEPSSEPLPANDVTVSAINAAVATMPPVDAVEVAKRKRLSDLVGLALSVMLDASNIGIKVNLEAPFGRFANSLGKSMTGSVQAQFEDIGRDGAVGLITACRKSSAECSEESKRMLKALGHDPRLTFVAEKVGIAGRMMVAHYTEVVVRLNQINGSADRRLGAAIDGVLSREADGPWGDLRRRKAADFDNGREADLTHSEKMGWSQFFDQWKDARSDIAARMIQSGEGVGEWDKAFLSWTAEDPERAAIWGYIVLNDPQIRPYLIKQQPSTIGQKIRVDDAYMVFAAILRKESWSRELTIPEYTVANSPAFQDAINKYCPHAY